MTGRQSHPDVRPPPAAEALLRWLLPRQDHGPILGDLNEEFITRVRADGTNAARRWYWRHLAQSIVPAVGRRRARMADARLTPRPAARWPGFSFGRELRLAARSLRRSPSYAATVMAVTALSMALASTVFAVVDGVLFKPLPYPDPDELYAVSGRFDDGVTSERGVALISPREVAAWSATAPTVMLTSILYTSVTLPDGAFQWAVAVDPSFFDVFGVRLLAGGFRDEDYATHQPAMPVIISHRLWRERFDRDPTVVGRILPPADDYSRPTQIVGILAMDGFVPPLPGSSAAAARRKNRVEVLRPPALSSSGELSTERSYMAFARIPHAEFSEAQAALDRAAAAYREAAPPLRAGLSAAARRARQPYDRVELIPLRDYVSSRERPVLALAFGMAMSLVVLVLLNVGALAMARMHQRTRDLSVRRALGARTRDLLRHSLAEQAVLFTGGAVAGILASPMLLAIVLERLPPGLNLVKDVRLDWRVMAFAGVVSATAAIAVALLSVRVAVRHASVTPSLADVHGGSPARARIGRLLVAGQTAMAFVLVLGGTLFAASLFRLWSEDPGLRVQNAATMNLFYRNYRESTTKQRWARALELARDLRSVPGVRGVALLDNSIMQNVMVGQSIFEAPASATADAPSPASVRVSSDFFEAAGIELVAGRLPSGAELDTGGALIVVSEAVARAYWPGQTAIGRNLRTTPPYGAPVDCTVVGIVRDVRLVALDVPSSGAIFASWSLPIQQYTGPRFLVSMSDDSVLSTVVTRLGQVEPAASIRTVELLEDAMAESIRERRLGAFAASAFGVIALIFVAMGVLGLVAMTASRRTREMAIRIALGAERARVTRLLVTEQLGAIALGLIAGGALAGWTVPIVGSRLYGVGAYDPAIWALTAGVIAGTATVGALIPAWSASRVDPVTSLKDA